MKAVVYERYGPPEVLQLKEVATPEPEADEILVRIRATTVRTGDWRMRKPDPFLARFYNGLFRPKRQILGFELAGEVAAEGSAVTRFKTGDQVFGSCGIEFGAHAQYICMLENGVVALKPDNLSYEESAALPSGALAALALVRDSGQVAPGQRVLIYGASGSIGTYAVQLARYFGAEVTAVCSAGSADLAKRLGASEVIDYRKVDVTKSGLRFDLIIDAVGKMITGIPKSRLKQALVPRGRFVTIDDDYDELQENLVYIGELAEAGVINPVIDRRYSLAQMTEAHRYVERGHKKGNVVVTVPHEKSGRISAQD